MPGYVTDNDPKITFPVWLLGSLGSPDDLGYLVDGLLHLTSNDGEPGILIFSSEQAAKTFLETHVGEMQGKIVKKVSKPIDLDMILEFFTQRIGARNVFIGKSEGRISVSPIIKVRFNIAMQF